MIPKYIYKVMLAMPVFKPEMRMANREGRKSQTRRVADQDFRMQKAIRVVADAKSGVFDFVFSDDTGILRKCPYGKAGNFCYMREPLVRGFGDVAYYKDDGVMVRHFLTGKAITWRWKKDVLTSIFMPKEAARSIYQYASIDVERVQEISRDDAKAEGVSGVWKNPPEKEEHYSRVMLNPYVANYSVLWDEINAERGYPWDSNPWVWALNYVEVRDAKG